MGYTPLGKFIPKITNFGDGAVSQHFKSHNGEVRHEGADVGLAISKHMTCPF